MTVQKFDDSLLQPWRMGPLELKHRVVIAPLTRFRAKQDTLAPNQLMARDGNCKNWVQATFVSNEAGGFPGTARCLTE
ncbi:hypothetical protein JCM24511_08127 [Saitozyma sp. JCM 24511]|nr:hypothetical protein JCM24511_08127 [Saitozyma sp. JCM 24511]